MKEFEEISQSLRDLIEEWEPLFLSMPPDLITERRNSQNRTIRQIVGHMCDSATNNAHRTIHLQYQESPLSYPNYATHGNNDRWIAIQNYQEEDWFNLIQLWKYTNLHIAHVFEQVDESKLENVWDAGDNQTVSLQDQILDYLRHFRLHLNEIAEIVAEG
ncbi:MAG: DinB family protein [Bacteroidales bacterium]|nr:DinB family protein [Bacteroidales bacterium]